MTTIRVVEPRQPWYDVLSETQFAVHQTVVGLRELGRAVHADQLFMGGAKEVRFMIHSGLFAYTTGVERLAKLALSLAHFRETGGYPSVKSFGHRITTLSDLLAELEPLPAPGLIGSEFLEPGNPLTPRPDFLKLLDDYALGAGRYEYLDSLHTGVNDLDVFQRWLSLTEQVTPSSTVRELCGVPMAIADALYSVSRAVESQLGIESFDHLIEPYLDNILPASLHPGSVEVALTYYDFAQWIAAHCSSLSGQIFYHDGHSIPPCPYLPEVTAQYLLIDRDSFIELHVLQLNDLQSTVEAVQEVMSQLPELTTDEEDT